MTATIYSKLFDLQKRLKPIKKDSVNPHFKNRYFDINTLIDAIRPELEAANLSIIQPLVIKDGKSTLQTILIDPATGEKLESSIELPTGLEPQKMGSAITYYRRYSLQSLLLLEAEDDDGNSTQRPAKAPYSAPQSFVKFPYGAPQSPVANAKQEPTQADYNDLPF